MAIQRADSDGQGTLPPPGFKIPPWKLLKEEWESVPPPISRTITIGPETLVMGHDDCENDDTLSYLEHQFAGHEFGWDNESPKREFLIEKFRIDTRPITNGEFYDFWEQKDIDIPIPVSWVQENGEIKVSDFVYFREQW
jgi:L-histidine Nalpha-methyltransferase / hercynylcysteine S-oxide synthase